MLIKGLNTVMRLSNSSNGKIKTFFDSHLKEKLAQGISWAKITEDILSELPNNVYVSFDIDGLDPALCPNTGTPVLGGLSTDQTFFMLKQLVQSGRKIIGFDLNEVSPGSQMTSDWDGNVGARVLFKLCNWTIESSKD
jgi:agmatinase